MKHSTESGFDRRDFIGALAAVGAGTLLANCGRSTVAATMQPHGFTAMYAGSVSAITAARTFGRCSATATIRAPCSRCRRRGSG